MALHFMTDKPAELLKAFEARIQQKEKEGKITTWEKSADGSYTHKSDNWGAKAGMKPTLEDDRLVFFIVPVGETDVTREVYAYYHGHLTETFLTHFHTMFTWARSSAQPAKSKKR